MKHKKIKPKEKILSLVLCLCMILSCLPVSAFAQTGVISHEHTADEWVSAYTVEEVRAMIEELPDVSQAEGMSADELSAAYEMAQKAYDAWETLTEEQQSALTYEKAKLSDLLEYMATLTEQTASYTTFVKSVAISYSGDDSKAQNLVTKAGYNLINKDLNDGAGGEYIYMGAKYGTGVDDALTGIVFVESDSSKDPYNTISFGGVTFYLVGGSGESNATGDGVVDLNDGAGGKYIYTYITRDKNYGAPITYLDWSNSSSSAAINTSKKPQNLNSGTKKGETIYLRVVRYELEYKDTWSYDDTYHWHDNTDGYPVYVSDKGTHTWSNGKCTVCGASHSGHTWSNGKCTICGGSHSGHSWSNGRCTVCGLYCSHKWSNGKCTVCGISHSGHSWSNGKCTVCGASHSGHSWSNGKCTVCGLYCSHSWSNGKCTTCGIYHSGHTWSNGKCTVCGISHSGHSWSNGKCTVCGASHSDHSWSNGKCTVCGLYCSHNWSNGKCTTCGVYHSGHSWSNGKCTVCGASHSDHSWSDGKCTVCGLFHSRHTWSGGKCTVCHYQCLHNDLIDGYCTVCGECLRAGKILTQPKNEDGIYLIYTTEQLKWFETYVNYRDGSINGKLMADIDASLEKDLGIGTSGSPYRGTFDGNNHALTVALEGTGECVAPFSYANNATFKNLTVKGTVQTSNKFGSGLIGKTLGGTVNVEKCLVEVVIYSTVNGDGTHGGFVGVVENGTLNINYCGFTGAINGADTTNCGGFVGWTSGDFNITNSYVAATFDLKSGNSSTFSRSSDSVKSKNVKVTNCYYLNALGDTYLGATKKSAAQFASGEVAYLLNGSEDNGIWRQTLGQNGDDMPNFTGDGVYKSTPCPVYANVLEQPHDYDENNVCKNCGEVKRTEPILNASENVYEIYNLSELLWFADKVNGGETGINGKLMKDIDASSQKTFGIGTSENPYSGIFDGNGKTIKIALETTTQYTALFPYVTGATVKELSVYGTIKTSAKFAGSFIGLVKDGTVTLETCISEVKITSTVSGDGTHGGLVANVGGGTLNIDYCGFNGEINGSATKNCGGLVGYSSGTTHISHSYHTAFFSVSGDGSSTFARGKNITVTNCYYANELGSANSGGVQKNMGCFANGEVAWLLNGSVDNGIWKQTLYTDKTPNFSGSAVYKTTGNCASYTNNEAEKTRDHDVENGVCKHCGNVMALTSAVWNESKQAYEIYSAAQLVWFSKLVNGTLDGVAQNQAANAVLMADIDMYTVTDYVPIGGTPGLYYSADGDDKGYQGIFDGNGHVIKNLSVKGSDTGELTYGIFGTLSGTVKHLGVERFIFTLGSKDCRAGGIAGQILSGGLIEDCYVANSIITATGKVAGGIAGCNYAGTVKRCHTYKVTVTASRAGGIVGDNRGDSDDNDRKGTVMYCYTDANSVENSGRKGNVTSSASGMSADDFALGQVCYQLDGNRGLWKLTVGSQDYPTFSGDCVNVSALKYSDTNVSVRISWTSMEFTYTYTGGTYNPTTHLYEGGTGTWSAADGGGAVTVENLGEWELTASFKLVNSIDGITGTFNIGEKNIPSGDSVTSTLTLSGEPSERYFNNMLIGSVNVTLKVSKVSIVAKTGVTYKCVVLGQRDGKYILMTEKATGEYKDNVSTLQVKSRAEEVGGRLPNFNYPEEKNYVLDRESINCVAVTKNGNWGIYDIKYNTFYAHENIKEYFHTYFVFEIPIN